MAKYNYNQTPTVVEPTVGTSWNAGLAFDICGTMEPALAASPTTATTGLTTTGNGVLFVAPKTASEAGNNATLGKFADGYTGLTLTNTTLKYPSATSTAVPEYTNGQKCGTGTPDAGKVGVVQARAWVISTKTGKNNEEVETGGVTTLKPANLKFLNRQLITVGFAPEGTALPKPPASTILALTQVLSGGQAPVRDDDHDRRHRRDHAHGAIGHHDERSGRHHDDETFVHDDDQVMKAVVLVGGEGTRLRPLTLSSPKQMLPIVGVPMIERVLGHLASHGVEDAVLSLGYLPDAFMEAYPEGRVAGMGLTYAVEPEPLDTAGAVRFAAIVRGHRRDVRGRQRRCADRSRPDQPRGLPPRARGRGDDRPLPGRRPLGLRRRAHGRGRAGDGLRREAAA